MNDSWMAVARGLKCLSISIRACQVAFALTVTALFAMVFLAITGPAVVKPPTWVVFLPAAVSSALALVFSRLARFFLVAMPRAVPGGRFSALASLVLELLGFTAFGAYVATEVIGFRIPDRIAIPWVAASFGCAFVGWLFFQRALSKLAAYTICPDAHNCLASMWILIVLGVALLIVGYAFVNILGDPVVIVLLSAACTLGGLVLFAIAASQYSQAASYLRFMVLRKARHCRNDGTGE